MIREVLVVFLGGGLGSIARYALGKWFLPLGSGFPVGTFLVNVTGAFFLGFLFSWFQKNQLHCSVYLLLAVGFCGGFTTFSTFSLELMELWRSKQEFMMVLYLAMSLIFGFLFCVGGFILGNTWN